MGDADKFMRDQRQQLVAYLDSRELDTLKQLKSYRAQLDQKYLSTPRAVTQCKDYENAVLQCHANAQSHRDKVNCHPLASAYYKCSEQAKLSLLNE